MRLDGFYSLFLLSKDFLLFVRTMVVLAVDLGAMKFNDFFELTYFVGCSGSKALLEEFFRLTGTEGGMYVGKFSGSADYVIVSGFCLEKALYDGGIEVSY